MEIVPFVPNRIRNAGKDFSKDGKNGAKKESITSKKITDPKKIKQNLEKTIERVSKKAKSKAKSRKGKRGKVSKLRGSRRLAGTQPESYEESRSVGQDDP